jgi:hypothetical protein
MTGSTNVDGCNSQLYDLNTSTMGSAGDGERLRGAAVGPKKP